MLAIQILKALSRTTASAELYQGKTLVAEVFANDGEPRRIYVSEFARAHGVDWAGLLAASADVNAMLDIADDEMRDVRRQLGED